MTYDIQPAFILGRYTCASLDYTAVEPVQVNMSGYRVVDHGPHADGHLPKVQDLLNATYCQLVCVDRQTLKEVAVIRDMLIGGYSGGFAARQLSQLSMSGTGIVVADESSENYEAADAASLP